MKILYVTDEWSQAGGAQHHLRDISTAIARTGATVRIAAGRFADSCPFPVQRVRALSSKVPSRRGLDSLGPWLQWADVVHVQNAMNPIALSLCSTTGKAVATVQDHRLFCPGPGKTLPCGAACREVFCEAACTPCLPDRAYREKTIGLVRERLGALAGSRTVALSRYMAGELSAAGIRGAEVIPPWVEPFDGLPAALRSGFLLAGRLVPHKAALAAYDAWRDSGTDEPLYVAGAGPLSRKMPLATQLGWMERAALRRQMASCRALLFPSRWQEPFGIAGLEALASGTPVIAMPAGGMNDWMGDGCIPVEDAPSMAGAMKRILSSPSWAAELGRAARAHALRHFSQGDILPRIERLYEGVAVGRKNPGAKGF